MMAWAMISGVWLAYSSMAALCLGLDRHYRQIWGHSTSKGRYRVLRGAGWLALASSLGCMALAWGWAMAPVAWLGSLSLGGLGLALALPYWPRAAIAAAVPGPLLASLTALQWAAS